jgi:hypothetical protein
MKKLYKTNLLDLLIGFFLMLIAGVMPLIVRVASRPLPMELMQYFLPTQFSEREGVSGLFYNDVFTYYKGLYLLIPAALITVFYVNDLIIGGKMPDYKPFFKKPHVILSLVYLAFVLISTLLSSYRHTSWFGTYDRGEGAFMWFSYFAVMFSAIYFVNKLDRAKLILYALAFSSIIMGRRKPVYRT